MVYVDDANVVAKVYRDDANGGAYTLMHGILLVANDYGYLPLVLRGVPQDPPPWLASDGIGGE
jgi:hypothetical protein